MRAANHTRIDPDQRLARLPCGICGKPSAGWVSTYLTDEEGRDVVEAYSACNVHRFEVIPAAKSQAG